MFLASNYDFQIIGIPVQLGTMLYQLFAFIVLLILLRMFALKPLLRVMAKRQEKIERDLKTAEDNRLEAERLLQEQRELLLKARQEAQEIVERARAYGEKEGAAIVEAARQEAERVKEQALQEIRQEREQAVAALREEIARISVALAAKIIEKELDEGENRKLVDRYLQEVGGLQ